MRLPKALRRLPVARRVEAVAGPALAIALAVLVATDLEPRGGADRTPEGRVSPTPSELTPAVEAVFESMSYAPGSVARLAVWSKAPGVSVRLFRAGPERTRTVGYQTMEGVPVTPTRRLGSLPAHGVVTVRIGGWPSGLYFARLTASDGRIGFAPFVVRPRRLGVERVAVVVPTMTWQAYNFRDEDHDGVSDTWYANPRTTAVELRRPFLDRGVPPHFRQYDLGFLHWLARTGRGVDFLSDTDLDAVASGEALARAYKLLVFPGHEEYVTAHMYDVVERFRDLGGHLAFLSANNFFYRVARDGTAIVRSGRWRDIGRPEARLVGIEYLDWNDARYPNRPYVVTGIRTAPWLFRGTGLRDGSSFGLFGIEIDAPTRDSPPGLHVLARIPGIFGPGQTATMTYYTTASGANVFAAGAFTMAGAEGPPRAIFLDNLWAWLTGP